MQRPEDPVSEGAPQDPLLFPPPSAHEDLRPFEELDRPAAAEPIGEFHVLEERQGLEAPHREILRRPDGER
jgi:hypothetical protein